MLSALRFYAKGGFLSEVSSIHGLSKSSMGRIIEKVSTYISSLAPETIKMPQQRYEEILISIYTTV